MLYFSDSDDDVTLPPSVYSSTETESLERGNSFLEDREADCKSLLVCVCMSLYADLWLHEYAVSWCPTGLDRVLPSRRLVQAM